MHITRVPSLMMIASAYGGKFLGREGNSREALQNADAFGKATFDFGVFRSGSKYRRAAKPLSKITEFESALVA
jgi:hypothetical protein